MEKIKIYTIVYKAMQNTGNSIITTNTNNKFKFTIITPTTGNKHLEKLLHSINNLINKSDKYDIEHFIVIDGEKFKDDANRILELVQPFAHIHRIITQLPINTGANEYLGHRIYAGFSHIVDGNYILFLDEDNWFEPTHIDIFYNLITKTNNQVEWLYCLRNIVDQNDNFLCKDFCESLGYVSHTFYNKNKYMIDTNCFCISRNVLIQTSWVWNMRSERGHYADRIFSEHLMTKYKKFLCTFEYSVSYRIGNRKESVGNLLFVRGNKFFSELYGKIPWEHGKNVLIVKNENKEKTDMTINGLYNNKLKLLNNNGTPFNCDNLVCVNGFSGCVPNNLKVFEITTTTT